MLDQINSENFYYNEKNLNHLSTLNVNNLPSIDDLEIAFRNFLVIFFFYNIKLNFVIYFQKLL